MRAVHSSRARDDHLLSTTRILSAFIIPFLIVGFGILYLFPDHTHQLFAWTIRPRMTPMMLGSAYLGGAYFFSRAALARRWHLVKAGFLPVATFAGILGVTTILHWDRFNHDHISFYVWTVLYFTTPFLVVAVWGSNRRRDPRTAAPGDQTLPMPTRVAMAVLGVVVLAVSAMLFLSPQTAIGFWPWTLTPLTARVIAAMFALGGVGGISVASDPRWSAARIPLESQVITLAGVDLAVVFAWPGFSPSNPLTWVFVGGLLSSLVAMLVLLTLMAARARTSVATSS